jgi:hypothetical protein
LDVKWQASSYQAWKSLPQSQNMAASAMLYLTYCSQSVELTKQAEWSLSTFRDQPTGTLRLTAPVNYGASVLVGVEQLP